jgi:hypothetical protein
MQVLTRELKRLEGPADLTFATREQAEEYGLQLCRAWIGGQPPQSKKEKSRGIENEDLLG